MQLRTALISTLLVAACGRAAKPNKPTPNPPEVNELTTQDAQGPAAPQADQTAKPRAPTTPNAVVELTGAEATTLLDALRASGVTDTTGAVGGVNLVVDEVVCRSGSSPVSVPECTVAPQRTMPAPHAAKIAALFDEHGGRVLPDAAGGTILRAKRVRCGAPVTPEPIARCSITVNY